MPSVFEKFETPEDLIVFLNVAGFGRFRAYGIDPTYAATLINGGITDARDVVKAWKKGLPVEYAVLALA